MAESDEANGDVRADLPMQGFAALITPATAWQAGTIPSNALVLVPMTKEPPAELIEKMKEGAVAISPDKMWEYLGFNGRPVQVMDKEGRPIAIGVEDLLNGLKQHYEQNKKDLNTGRLYSQELMKHGRTDQAEGVLARVVASGGGGQDWLALGVAQLANKNFEKAESTLKGAQSLLKTNPYPALNLAKLYAATERSLEQTQAVEHAIELDPKCVDAWAYLFSMHRARSGEEEAVQAVVTLAERDSNKHTAAPYVALQGIFAGAENALDKAMEWAQKAVERDGSDVLALISLSALQGQKGDIQAAIALLSKHENKMMTSVGLANNYLNALLQAGQIDRATRLLNALGGSQQADVKRFAQASSSALAREFQRRQNALQKGAQGAGPLIQKA